MNRPTFDELELGRPLLPAETCPLIDRTSTLADATAADLARIRDELRAAGDVEHADELGEVLGCLATEMRERLELLRTANAQFREAVGYWRRAARELAPIEASTVAAWAAGADVFELGVAAVAIRKRVAELGAKVDAGEGPIILRGDELDRAAIEAALHKAPPARVAFVPSSSESLDFALAFAETADVDELEQLAQAIRRRIAGVADELEGAKIQ